MAADLNDHGRFVRGFPDIVGVAFLLWLGGGSGCTGSVVLLADILEVHRRLRVKWMENSILMSLDGET